MGPNEIQFLEQIRGADADVRFTAWRRAGEMSAEVIGDLAKLANSNQPGVAKAAAEAMETLTNQACAERGARAAAVEKQLVQLLADGNPERVRVVALRQLSLIGGNAAVPAAAKLLADVALREEAAFCLERIPGPVATEAFMAAFKTVPVAFKPRMLAALGHRRSEEAAALIGLAMLSPDREVAMAAVKAWGRLGKRAASAGRLPSRAGLTEWQRIELLDSQVRFAEAQAAAGNHAEAIRLFRAFLEEKEEHWQCAGLMGLARVPKPEAAAAIYPKLSSKDAKVRLTAARAWEALRRGA